MKKREIRRRNPVARALRRIRPQVVPSAKAYRRKPKHKGHSEIIRNDLFLFFVPVAASPLFASFLRFGERPGEATPPPAAAS